MDIWRYQERLTAALLAWSATSVVAGLVLSRGKIRFANGVGEQFVGWGLINAAIAVFGLRGARRRRAAQEAGTSETQAREKRNLARLLWINAVLDVLYVLGGTWVTRTRGAGDEHWRGRGWGIVLQGGFLFSFDVANGLLLRRVDTSTPAREP